MGWRPEGWANRQKDFVKINVGETRAYFKNGADQYESGAEDMLAARDKDWITWAESQCPHGGIDSGGMICLECYQCWMERKKGLNDR